MSLVEVIVILFCVLVLSFVVSSFIHKKINKLPTGDCEYCKKSRRRMLKEYRKYYSSKM